MVAPGQGKSRGARRRRQRAELPSEIGTKVLAPVAVGYRRTNPVARINGRGNVVVIQHREYIADIIGSVGYTVLGFPINPGVGTTFPWLSILARNFEKYRFRRCTFCFESSVATTTAGVVLSAIDLDANDPAPPTKQIIMAYQGANRSNVWAEHCTNLPEMQPELYVRTATAPSGTDIKTYDAGNLWLATQGEVDNTTPIGELYVDYVVELHVPQLASVANNPSLSVNNTVTNFTGATFTGSFPFITGLSVGSLASDLGFLLPLNARILVTNTVVGTAPGSGVTQSAATGGTYPGSAGVLVGSTVTSSSTSTNQYVWQVTGLSNGGAGIPAGYFWLRFSPGTITGVIEFFVDAVPWQTNLQFP